MKVSDINRYLDHAVLKPELTHAEAMEAIKLGIQYKVRTVCVRPCDIEAAVSLCAGTETQVSCVLAFPHGCTTSAVKAEEAAQYIAAGANEIDMVVNYGFIRSGMWDEVIADIRAVTDVAKPAGVLVKTILETVHLTPEEIRQAVECAITANADFVKTSTGFAPEGDTEAAVRIMLEVADGRVSVKPSGGVRDRAKAELYVSLGAERLGINYTSVKAICDGGETGNGTY